jgi:Na+-driven multidrug efflux pump
MRSRYRYFEWLAFEPGLLRRLTTLSGPMVVQFLLGSTVWLYFFTRLEKMGEDALAISNVVKLIYMALATTTWGLGGAVNTMVSNLMGQGRPADVVVAVKRSVVVGFGMALVAATLLLLFPAVLLQAFTVDRPDLVALGLGPLRLTAFALLLMAISVTLFRTVTGLGATGYSLLSECLAVPFYLLYVELVIVRGNMGLTWAWGSEFVYWGVTGLACLAYLRWGRWRDITF